MPNDHCPKVSVMMPVYNSERYVTRAINSILTQTYENLEFLIVDDASSDDSWKIVEKFAAKDSRMRIFRNEKNRGVPYSRNFLFGKISPDSEFLAIMDSDDLALPERLAKQVAYLQAHPELHGVGSALQIINEEGEVIAHRQYECVPEKILHQAIAANPFAHPTITFRRSLIEEIGKYDESYRSCEDYDFLLRALRVRKFGNLPDELLQYRVSTTQWKQTHLRDTLLATLAIQRSYLFTRRFFSFYGLFLHLCSYFLLLLPATWVLRLFMRMRYSRCEAPLS